jgi:hypothetical protein
MHQAIPDADASVTPDAELAPLRRAGRLVVVEPDSSDIEARRT